MDAKPRQLISSRRVLVTALVSAVIAATAAGAVVATDPSSTPTVTAGGWTLNGSARAVPSGIQLTQVGQVATSGTAFWPAPIDLTRPVSIGFDATIDGGGPAGGDGIALVFGDASDGAHAGSVGESGRALGFGGIPGVAVALDTYQNLGEPSDNFIGIADGTTLAGLPNYVSATTAIPDLRAGTHHVRVDATPGHLNVVLDGRWIRTTDIALPTRTYIGFTAANGAFTDDHTVTNITTTGMPSMPSTPTTTPVTAPATTSVTSPPVVSPDACVGVAMTRGQADIDAAPGGTTFCLSGTHNWTLYPKTGDRLLGPAVLDGAHVTQYAVRAATAANVVLSDLEVRNYTAADQRGAINVLDQDKRTASGWQLNDLSVHDNGTAAGGAGANLGNGWQVNGGRYYDNRQEGIGGAGNGATVDGTEIDHNNYTDDTFTAPTVDCGYEAGGMKWVADNVTITNSNIHDNACKGLWVDINSNGITITNNRITDNWNEGIFIEISSNATITGNTVTGNGFHTNPGSGNGCAWLWGGGITIASSDHTDIADNTLSGNCNGITGTQQTRPDANPGLLENMNVHNNTITNSGKNGVAADNGANLQTRAITFSNNTIIGGLLCTLLC